MRPSHLRPTTAPSSTGQHFTQNTAVIGHDSRQEAAELLRSFDASFSRLDAHPQNLALVVTTSGSTGAPKQTALTAAALAASARATEAFTETECAQWLLALPLHYVAGAQVLARSALAGTSPVLTDSISRGESFTAADFIASTGRLTAAQRMVSLVPTQLHKLLDTANPTQPQETLDALRSFSAVLLGGAPASTALLERSAQLGIRVLTTYGSAETAGGCVYTGAPLPGVQVHIEPETPEDESTGTGRIWLGGSTLAAGYLDDPKRTATHFFTDPNGTPWYRTDDRGTRTGQPGSGCPGSGEPETRLTVLGRADDTVITGGLKISAGALARTLETHPAVREAMVFGLDDARWGQVLAAAITPTRTGRAENLLPGLLAPTSALAQELSELVSSQLGRAAIPKLTLVFEDFPVLSTGKPDRTSLAAALRAHHHQP